MQSVSRLYTHMRPAHYDLKLNLKRKERTFDGHVALTGTLVGKTKTVGLHAKGLTITACKVDGKSVEHRVDGDELWIDAPDVTGDITIAIDFTGKITDAMHGMYPCYYEHNGVKKELLATQFESHHAREVFPCIDEPEAKAVFDVTLETEAGVEVLGNMPIKLQTKAAHGLTTTFDSSPKMSPYLVAFVVGELQKKTATTKSGVVVNTWATKAQPVASLDFGLEVAVKTIDFFDEYFGTPYPLPKCDHVALPDFSSGAMENWGLITYREICLLSEKTSAISSKQYVATVIAHETSHQWFGNLVTMKWWDDLWLNESFATLMEYVAVDHIFPDWDIWTTFATQEALSALRRDYLPGVQAVKTAVHHPDEISTLFDPSIVYAKGARLLAMLRLFVGDEAFQNGLADYFKTHAYSNTVGEDLWAALTAHSPHDVSAFMTPWIEQNGLPRVSVKRSRDGIIIAQSPFIIPEPHEKTKRVWPIPLHGSDGMPEMLETATTTANETGVRIQLNHGAITHMVSEYDGDLFNDMVTAVKNEELDVVDRLTLLHDTTLLARAGSSSAIDIVKLITCFAHERKGAVWDIVSLAISDIKRLIEPDDLAEDSLKGMIRELVTSRYSELGWDMREGESEDDTKQRATIIGMLSYAEDPHVIAEGLKRFHETKTAELDGELRPIICSIATRHGTKADVMSLRNDYKATSSSELRNDITSGLTSTRDKHLIKELLGDLTNMELIRSQDVFRWFAWLMRNREAKDMSWQWMIEHWDWIVNEFAGDKSYDDFARYSASALTTHAWLTRYQNFFASKRSITALTRAIDLGVADIAVRAEWYDRDHKSLCHYLKSEVATP